MKFSMRVVFHEKIVQRKISTRSDWPRKSIAAEKCLLYSEMHTRTSFSFGLFWNSCSVFRTLVKYRQNVLR